MSLTHPHNTPTVAFDLLDHDFDDEDVSAPELHAPAATPAPASSPVPAPVPAPVATEPPSITTPAGRRVAISLSIAAALLGAVLLALLVLPTGRGRETNLAAFGSPTITATDMPSTTAPESSTSSSTPDDTVTIQTTPNTRLEVPSTVTTVRRPPVTTAPTVPPTTAPPTSSTTSSTTPKPPADITTLTGSKVGLCMVPATKLQVLITYATTNATSVELSVDNGPKTSLDATNGTTQAPFTCNKPTHTYTLFAHGPGGDIKQSIVVS